LVKLSRTVQISGKMLIASKSTMDGATKIQAIARSDNPLMRRASTGGVACAARSIEEWSMVFP